jgi:hypothetical protein
MFSHQPNFDKIKRRAAWNWASKRQHGAASWASKFRWYQISRSCHIRHFSVRYFNAFGIFSFEISIFEIFLFGIFAFEVISLEILSCSRQKHIFLQAAEGWLKKLILKISKTFLIAVNRMLYRLGHPLPIGPWAELGHFVHVSPIYIFWVLCFMSMHTFFWICGLSTVRGYEYTVYYIPSMIRPYPTLLLIRPYPRKDDKIHG